MVDNKNEHKSPMQRFSRDEIDFVKKNFIALSHYAIGVILGRSEGSIRNLCYRKRWKKAVENWTADELEQLQNYYNSHPIIDMSELEKMFPGRMKSNICRKARLFGLTNQHRSMSEKHKMGISHRAQKRIAENGHPRGFLGHHHSQSAREIISKKSRDMWANKDCVLHSEENKQKHSDRMAQLQREGKMRNGYSRGSMGKRDDLGGLYVRSSWEANYCRYLNWLIAHGEIMSWEYEPCVFEFAEIKRGVRSYIPDFKIVNVDGSIEYHEVKGWMDPKSLTKLKRMKKYYPEIKIVLIDSEQYYAIAKVMKAFIPNWETASRKR